MAEQRDVSVLESQLAFEMLITGATSSLIAASDRTFASTVESVLSQAARFFGADQALLLSAPSPRPDVHVLYSWRREGAGPSDVDGTFENIAERLPWVGALTITNLQPLVMDEHHELPTEAQRDREWFVANEVRSAMWVPVATAPDRRFILAVESTHSTVRWPDWAVNRLPRLGEILAHFIERQRAAVDSSEANARNALAILSADAGVWDCDLATGRIWATPAARALYGFAPDEDITRTLSCRSSTRRISTTSAGAWPRSGRKPSSTASIASSFREAVCAGLRRADGSTGHPTAPCHTSLVSRWMSRRGNSRKPSIGQAPPNCRRQSRRPGWAST